MRNEDSEVKEHAKRDTEGGACKQFDPGKPCKRSKIHCFIKVSLASFSSFCYEGQSSLRDSLTWSPVGKKLC